MSEKKVCVKVGVRRNCYKYSVFMLFYKRGQNCFDKVYVTQYVCSGVDIAKSVVSSYPGLTKGFYISDSKGNSYSPGLTNVYCISDPKGNWYYYHPKWRKWYKNLDDKHLRLYFNWLIPEKVSNKLSPD